MSGPKERADLGVGHCTLELDRRLRFLTAKEVNVIDDLLTSVSPFGEVRLAVEKGRLRFLSSVKSHDAFQLLGKSGKSGD